MFDAKALDPELLDLIEQVQEKIIATDDNSSGATDAGEASLFLLLERLKRALKPQGSTPHRPNSRFTPAKLKKPTTKSKTKDLTDRVYRILLKSDAPQKTRDLVAQLTQAGAEIGGANPVANLSAKLSADGRFQNPRRKGWELIARPKEVAQPIFTPVATPAAPESSAAQAPIAANPLSFLVKRKPAAE